MLAASILEVGSLSHCRDGVCFAAFGQGQPSPGSMLLDGNLACPIGVVCFGEPVLEDAQLIDGVLCLRQVPTASGADRAAKPSDRLGLRERSLGNLKRRSLRPRSTLERVADWNCRKGRVPAVAEARRIFGNAVARIDDAFHLPILPQLQVG